MPCDTRQNQPQCNAWWVRLAAEPPPTPSWEAYLFHARCDANGQITNPVHTPLYHLPVLPHLIEPPNPQDAPAAVPPSVHLPLATPSNEESPNSDSEDSYSEHDSDIELIGHNPAPQPQVAEILARPPPVPSGNPYAISLPPAAPQAAPQIQAYPQAPIAARPRPHKLSNLLPTPRN